MRTTWVIFCAFVLTGWSLPNGDGSPVRGCVHPTTGVIFEINFDSDANGSVGKLFQRDAVTS